MPYSLGIDLGTTFSAAATLDADDSAPSMVGLGNRAMQIPSVIYIRDDDSLVVGEQAEHLAMSDPTRVAREFKRRLGDPVDMIVAGRSYAPKFFMAELLRFILDQTVERRGEPPSHVTLTHPASWGDFTLKLLRDAGTAAGLPNVATCPEPVAAALNYAANNRVAVGDRICVYDLGGGTFDVCVLEKTPDGFDVIGSPDGDSELGGINFDKAIIKKIVDDNPSVFSVVDSDDPGLFRFQRDCVGAKEALSVDVDTVIPLTISGSTTRVRLTRPEFESLIDGDLNRTIERTRRELTKAALDASELRSFVLIGGSSRIPFVTEKLSTAFRAAVARNAHPKHEVALGAALAGRLQSKGISSHSAQDVCDPVRPPLPVKRRTYIGTPRRVLLVGAAGISAAVLVGGVIIATGVFTGTAEAQKPATMAVAATASSIDHPAGGGPVTTPTDSIGQRPLTSSPLTTASTVEPTSPVTAGSSVGDPGVSPSGIRPTPAPPSTFDQLTVRWFQTLCSGGYELMQHDLRAGQSYRSLADAQTSFVQSFVQRADIAASTGAALEGLGPGPVARGNMDTTGSIRGLRQLAVSLRAGAQKLQSLSPQTSSDLTVAARLLNEQAAADHRPADLGMLTEAERQYVTDLPGCSG